MEKIFKLIKKNLLTQVQLKDLLLSNKGFSNTACDITYKGVGLLHFLVDLANVSLLQTTLEIAPSSLLTQVDKSELPILAYAILTTNDKDIIQLLLDYPLILESCEKDTGLEPLHLAVQNNNVEIIKLLIAKNHNLNKPEPENWDTPLHLACRLGFDQAADLLIEAGCLTQIFNKKKQLPLHLAVDSALPNITKLLLSSSTFSLDNCEDDQGNTPLHIARLKKQSGIAQILIKAGFFEDQKNKFFETPNSILETQSLKDAKTVEQKEQKRREKNEIKRRTTKLAMENTDVSRFLQEYQLDYLIPSFYKKRIFHMNECFQNFTVAKLCRMSFTVKEARNIVKAIEQKKKIEYEKERVLSINHERNVRRQRCWNYIFSVCKRT